MYYKEDNLIIRPVKEEDLPELWKIIYGDEFPEWKKWDAPYYSHRQISYAEYYSKKEKTIDQENLWAIEIDGLVVGTISYYWEHKPSNWLEIGIGIYNPEYWSGGYGTKVMRLWINHLFNSMPLVRVGYTTWSGNDRMVKVGEKLGMTMEARLRRCRFYNGEYYDSIRMGLLREEWEDNPVFS